MAYDDFRIYPESQPLAVENGIKAKSKRGAFVENWWSKRWIAVLESFRLGARLTRGRRYARQGQVIAIDIDPGQVTASVQGSRKRPYRVVIRLNPFSEAQWEKVISCLISQPLLVASLLAGEMPGNIENVFEEAGLSLFPKKTMDLETDCSCPDWSNPCKHIAAVYYLLGEEFDRNPFLIFKLRGLDRDELMSMLAGEAAPENSPQEDFETGIIASYEEEIALSTDPKKFWGGSLLPQEVLAADVIPGSRSCRALLKQVGEFPFWQGDESLLDSLEPIYERVSMVGHKLYMGKENTN